MKTNESKKYEPKKSATKTKETLVLALLALSIVAVFGGFALVSRGTPMGWISVVAALPMLFVVQRAMRLGASTPAPEAPAREISES